MVLFSFTKSRAGKPCPGQGSCLTYWALRRKSGSHGSEGSSKEETDSRDDVVYVFFLITNVKPGERPQMTPKLKYEGAPADIGCQCSKSPLPAVRVASSMESDEAMAGSICLARGSLADPDTGDNSSLVSRADLAPAFTESITICYCWVESIYAQHPESAPEAAGVRT